MNSVPKVSCSFESPDQKASISMVVVKHEVQDNSEWNPAVNPSLPSVRRSGRTPVLSSKFRDMEVSLLIIKKAESLATETESELSKNRNRKSSCQEASRKELSTLRIDADETIVKIECCEEENVVSDAEGEAPFYEAVDLNSGISDCVHPCVTKVELVETNEALHFASINTKVVPGDAVTTHMDGQGAQCLEGSVISDALSLSPVTHLNAESQLATSSTAQPQPAACLAKEDVPSLKTQFQGLECLESTFSNHPAVPFVTPSKRNCYYCYKVHSAVSRTKVQCKTCKIHLCLNAVRNCLVLFHYGKLKPSFSPDVPPHISIDARANSRPGPKSHKVLTGGLRCHGAGEDIFSFTPLSHPPIPIVMSVKRNCMFCYRLERRVRRSKIMCQICKRYYCLNKERNCLVLHHDGKI